MPEKTGLRKLSLPRLGRAMGLSAGSRTSESSRRSSRSTEPSKVELDDVYGPKADDFAYENHRFEDREEESDGEDASDAGPEVEPFGEGSSSGDARSSAGKKPSTVDKKTTQFLADLEFSSEPTRASQVLRELDDDLEAVLQVHYDIDRVKAATVRREKKKAKKKGEATMRRPIREKTSMLRRPKKA